MSTKAAELLLSAGFDPREDFVEWQALHLVVEAKAEGVDWRTDVVYRRRMAALLEYPGRSDVTEVHYRPWAEPGEAVNERYVPKRDTFPLPQNSEASRRQCEERCPSCGGPMELHPVLRSSQLAMTRSRRSTDDEYMVYLAQLRNVKAAHEASGLPTYVCCRVASAIRSSYGVVHLEDAFKTGVCSTVG